MRACDVVIAGVCRHMMSVADVCEHVMLSLPVYAGTWCCHCRCMQARDVIAGVCRHMMHCSCMQVCDIVIAGVCRHVMSLHVSAGM